MRQQKSSMYKVAKAILKNEEDIADAMQDTILDCWEKIHTLRKPEYFKTWLIRILINNSNAIYNQRSKMVLDNDILIGEAVEDSFDNIEWQEMMNCLNQKQRIVVELYYVEQFKVREIAEILHIGQGDLQCECYSLRGKDISKLHIYITQNEADALELMTAKTEKRAKKISEYDFVLDVK